MVNDSTSDNPAQKENAYVICSVSGGDSDCFTVLEALVRANL